MYNTLVDNKLYGYKKRAKVTYWVWLYGKMTRKPVQKSKIEPMQSETVPFCLIAPAGPCYIIRSVLLEPQNERTALT